MSEEDKKHNEENEPKGQGEQGDNKASESNTEGQKAGEKLYTEEDVNNLLDRKFAVLSSKFEKRLADEKAKITEAQKLKEMNEEEKSKYENEKLQARIDELEREKNLTEQMGVARKELRDAGINLDDNLLSIFVSPTAEVTKEAIDSIKKLWPEAVNAAVQDALKRENPPKGEPSDSKGKTSYGAQYAAKKNAELVPQTNNK